MSEVYKIKLSDGELTLRELDNGKATFVISYDGELKVIELDLNFILGSTYDESGDPVTPDSLLRAINEAGYTAKDLFEFAIQNTPRIPGVHDVES